MPEEPKAEPDETVPPDQAEAGPSTDLVLPPRRPPVAPARQWPGVVVRARSQLLRLRQNPTAMVAVSAAATLGSAVVTAGLRHGLRAAPSAGRIVAVTVGGHHVHEVHVIHHVVHHVVHHADRPPAD
jgi:hypothetical protein